MVRFIFRCLITIEGQSVKCIVLFYPQQKGDKICNAMQLRAMHGEREYDISLDYSEIQKMGIVPVAGAETKKATVGMQLLYNKKIPDVVVKAIKLTLSQAAKLLSRSSCSEEYDNVRVVKHPRSQKTTLVAGEFIYLSHITVPDFTSPPPPKV